MKREDELLLQVVLATTGHELKQLILCGRSFAFPAPSGGRCQIFDRTPRTWYAESAAVTTNTESGSQVYQSCTNMHWRQQSVRIITIRSQFQRTGCLGHQREWLSCTIVDDTKQVGADLQN